MTYDQRQAFKKQNKKVHYKRTILSVTAMRTEQITNKRLEIKTIHGTDMNSNKERTEVRLILANRR